MDIKAWKVVVKWWDPPKTIGPDGKAINVLKAEDDWDDKNEKASERNPKH